MSFINKNKHVDLINTKVIHDGFNKYYEYRLCYRLFNGKWSHEVTREVVMCSQVASVLLLNIKTDCILFVEQFRPAILFEKNEPTPWMIEVVAGRVDPNETIEQAALREVYEETGCHVDQLHEIADFYTSVGMTNEKVKLYCGIFSSEISDGEICGNLDESEDIKIHIIPVQKMYQHLEKGVINNATSIIAVQWLKMNYDRLKNSSS